MNELLTERQVTCPSCWETHTVLIDLTDTQKSLIEDCTVCCNPMQISFDICGGDVQNLHVETLV